MTFKFNWLPAAGTLLLVSGLLTHVVLRVAPRRAVAVYAATLDQLKWAILTVLPVLALAYVMNLSGQTITLGTWLAGAGGVVRVPVADHRLARHRGDRLGHVVELAVRRAAGHGGPEGRPRPDAAGRREQLRRRAGQDDLAAEPGDRRRRGRAGGQEGDLFRKVIGWSSCSCWCMCVIVYLQIHSVLSWMVVGS